MHDADIRYRAPFCAEFTVLPIIFPASILVLILIMCRVSVLLRAY